MTNQELELLKDAIREVEDIRRAKQQWNDAREIETRVSGKSVTITIGPDEAGEVLLACLESFISDQMDGLAFDQHLDQQVKHAEDRLADVMND